MLIKGGRHAGGVTLLMKGQACWWSDDADEGGRHAGGVTMLMKGAGMLVE